MGNDVSGKSYFSILIINYARCELYYLNSMEKIPVPKLVIDKSIRHTTQARSLVCLCSAY